MIKEATMTRTSTSQGPFSAVLGSIFLVIFGIIMIFISSFMAGRDVKVKERCIEQVQATVTAFEHSKDHESKKESEAVTPVFDYEYNGQQYSSSAGSYSTSYKDIFKVGQQYTIFINPDDPVEIYSQEIASSDSMMFKILKWVGIALIPIGIISFIFSVIKLIAIGGAIGFGLSQLLKK